jgi:hypothetical protein
MYGRGKPRLGGLTIEETVTSDRQRKASYKRRKETRDGSKVDGAEMKCELELYEYVLVQT